MKRVIIESPYAGPTPEIVERNLTYLRACMHDCLHRGESPYASHGLYTQPGVLDDKDPAERKHGIEAGFAWKAVAELTAVYQDFGITDGMKKGIEASFKLGQPVEFRTLPDQDLVASLLAWTPKPAASKAAVEAHIEDDLKRDAEREGSWDRDE